VRRYSTTISLVKNARGCWGFDTVKGCGSGMAHSPGGCYGVCYAFRAANQRGFDFAHPVLRRFKNEKHRQQIIRHIQSIDNEFVRIGVMGDPSENWDHTIEICEQIQAAGKRIVIVTKHWKPLPFNLYNRVMRMGLVVNTSISALDTESQRTHRLQQYNRLKLICKSVLRIVSCDFNMESKQGRKLDAIQQSLFDNENTIDNMLRVSKNHPMVVSGTIKIKRRQFLTGKTTVSEKNKNTHIGPCADCPDRCGLS